MLGLASAITRSVRWPIWDANGSSAMCAYSRRWTQTSISRSTRPLGLPPLDGTLVEQNVVLCLEFDGNQVVRIVEFANPAIVLANRESVGRLRSR